MGTRSFRYKPVAFVDDDRHKVGTSIMGVPIAGLCKDISAVVAVYSVDVAVIAIPSASPSVRRDLVEACQRAPVPVKILPSTSELLDTGVSITHIREVDPADLLGRPMARLDRSLIEEFIRGKRVLVTGAAGSVGSELSKQIAALRPSHLLLVDHAENPMLFLDSELRDRFPDIQVDPQIVDITDNHALGRLMAGCRPQIVFHAAAHKHVPLMERHPAAAVRNNVGGTLSVSRCAQDTGVEKFVLVSTDKAVRPSSVMGATKRLVEMITQELNSHGTTRFVSVRFGNVLGSNASVVPIFKQQIGNGGPVTVTHREIQRYFMSVSEAASLILQAGSLGEGGDTFVLDMGEPVNITTLAETLITLSGLKPYEDIDIVFTGIRPGEKLSEELCSQGQELVATQYDKLLLLTGDPIPQGVLASADELLQLLPSLDSPEIVSRLKELVPDYEPLGRVSSVPN